MRLKKRSALSLMIGLALVITLGYATTTLAAEAAKTAADTSWKFHDIVDVDFVMQQIKVPMPPDAMIIDARPKRVKYDKGHIPMAVFYCGGLKCKLSHKSAAKAEKLGYTNVSVFAEGFPGYMKVAGNYAGVSADWVQKQIDKKTDMALIDSRPKRKKYDKGHIPTAISIPDMRFDKMTAELPQDKDKLLVFYCGGYKCKLSHKSAKKAIALGYTRVKVFAAGYPAWKTAYGSSAAAAAKPAATQLKNGKEEGSIDTAMFTDIVRNQPESIYLIDVRDADEFAGGSFKTAINMPVDTLEEKIKTLPTDKPIVFVCGTGARSGESYYMVQDLRPEMKSVYYLEGELTFSKDGTFKITDPVS
jgi:rhodanese-related sulfurtransferase